MSSPTPICATTMSSTTCLPVEIPIPPIAEIQQALYDAAAEVTGEEPQDAEDSGSGPAPSSPPTTATGSFATRLSALRFNQRRAVAIDMESPPSPPRAIASGCPTAPCSASPTSRCTARSSCPARPTPSTSGRSASTCGSASRRCDILKRRGRRPPQPQAAQLRRAAVPLENSSSLQGEGISRLRSPVLDPPQRGRRQGPRGGDIGFQRVEVRHAAGRVRPSRKIVKLSPPLARKLFIATR